MFYKHETLNYVPFVIAMSGTLHGYQLSASSLFYTLLSFNRGPGFGYALLPIISMTGLGREGGELDKTLGKVFSAFVVIPITCIYIELDWGCA